VTQPDEIIEIFLKNCNTQLCKNLYQKYKKLCNLTRRYANVKIDRANMQNHRKGRYFMPVIERLKKLKEERHITTAQWALLSNIPASTISRILSGDTGSPNFETMIRLVSSVKGSLDEIAGIIIDKPCDCSEEKEQMYIRIIEEKDALILEKENEISQKEKRILEEKKEKHQVAIYAMAVTAFTILMLLLKVFNII
jgi:transcriptional regulator with XRE-family HTH domain